MLAIVEMDLKTRGLKVEASGFRSEEDLGRAVARVRSLDQQEKAYLTGHIVQVTDKTGSRDAIAWAKAYGVLILGNNRVLVLGTLGIFEAHADAAHFEVNRLEPKLPRRESPTPAGTTLPKGKYEATRGKRELQEALGKIRRCNSLRAVMLTTGQLIQAMPAHAKELEAAAAKWSMPEEGAN